MLYELIGIVRPGNLAEVKDIVRATGNLILSSGGVIRSITNWGVYQLPKRTLKNQATYFEGHHFIMRYDASSAVQDDVRRLMGLDPRMIRFGSVKLGNGKLESIAKIGGAVSWTEREDDGR